MDKKAQSKPMKQILRRFDVNTFEFVHFGNKVLCLSRCSVSPPLAPVSPGIPVFCLFLHQVPAGGPRGDVAGG